MIIVIKPHTSRAQIDEVIAEVQKLGYDPRPIFGTELTVIAAIGDETTHHRLESLNAMPQVEKVMAVQKRFKLVSRESHPGNSIIDVDGVKIGGGNFVLMAGPCSVESEEQLLSTAHAVKAAGDAASTARTAYGIAASVALTAFAGAYILDKRRVPPEG